MKTVMVYQCELDQEIEMELYGLLRYVGKSFGAFGLTENKVYQCVGIDGGWLRIVDDEEEDYLYSSKRPGPATQDPATITARWEIVEIYNEELRKVLEQ